MKPSKAFRSKLRAGKTFLLLLGVLLTAGLLWADTTEDLLAFSMVSFSAILPLVLWLRAGAPGIPVLPVAAALYFIFYALPILRNNVGDYDSWEIVELSAIVCSFLLAATAVWWPLISKISRRSSNAVPNHILDSQITLLMFLGLATGLLFHLALRLQVLDWMGSSVGVVRSVAMTATSVACFLLGHARARGLLKGAQWRWAIAAFSLLILLISSSLFLIGSVMYTVAALFGYMITTRRVPWKSVIAASVVIFVLHAGKGEVRHKYWLPGTNYDAGIALTQLPGLLAEWTQAGVTAIVSGKSKNEQNVVDRASLLRLLMNVVRVTPDYIPYLGGETYVLLPQMLIPRFLDENKIASQAAMTMLNIRYGHQTADQANVTAIGWGLIAEGYANFGNWGVVSVGILFGVLTALFTRFSAGAAALSLPSLLAVAAMMILMNPEVDLAYLMTNLWQGLISLFIFFSLCKQFMPQSSRPTRRAVKGPVRVAPIDDGLRPTRLN